jgi:uncharacterized protein DUF4255
MLDDLDQTLRTLLLEELPRVSERIDPAGVDVAFDVPNREFSTRLTRPTLNLYLYDIHEDRERGRQAWRSGRLNGVGVVERPPVRLDCAYMITAWSGEVQDEHRLLAGATRVFFRNPVLPPRVVQGALPADIEIRCEVAQAEAIGDVADIWSVLDNDLRPSLRVMVTVPFDLDVWREAPLVVGREIDLRPPLNLDRTGVRRVEGRAFIGDLPLANTVLSVDGNSTATREDGAFELRAVHTGRQRVILATPGVDDLEIEIPPEGPIELRLPAPNGGAAGK